MTVKLIPDENLKHSKADWRLCLADFVRDSNETVSELDISTKLKLELYPSILDLCKLAKITYSSLDHGEKEIISTNSAADWVHANLQGIAKNQITPQLNSACTFALQILETVQENLDATSDPLQIIITGHSLGGWLAQVATFAVKYLALAKEGNEFIRRAETDLWHPHCVVFDSPGAGLILNYLNSYSELRESHDSHTVTLDICNYVILPNAVNVINPPFGDMVQLVAPDSIPAFGPISSGGMKKYSHTLKHTFKFHDIEVFKTALESSIFTLYSVVNWPMAVFEGWNTYADKDKGFAKALIKAARFGWKAGEAMDDFFSWLSSPRDYKTFKVLKLEGEETNVAATRLSGIESTNLEKLREIFLWKEHIGHDNMQVIDSSTESHVILGLDYKCKVENGRINFETKGKYTVFKNCCTFNVLKDLSSKIEHLPDYDLTNILLKSEMYCDEMLSKYSSVKFSGNSSHGIYTENDQGSFKFVRSSDKDWLKLVLLEYAFLKRSKSQNETLILKHDQGSKIYDRNSMIGKYGIKLVIIDSIDEINEITYDTIKEMSCIPGINYVWLQQSILPTPAENFTEKLVVDNELMGSILESEIILLGQSHLLKDIFTNKVQRQELKTFLESSPSSLLAILQGNAEIGHALKTAYDLENTYFNIARKMSGTELRDYYSKKFDKFKTIVVFQCDCEHFKARTEVYKHLGSALTVEIHILPRDTTNPFKEFQNICKANHDCIVDSVSYSSGINLSHPFELMYQYTPEFYTKRKIRKPGIKSGVVCSYLKFEKGIESFYLGRGEQKFDIEISENDCTDNKNSNIATEIVKKFEDISCNMYKSAHFNIDPEGDGHMCTLKQSSEKVSQKPDPNSDLNPCIKFNYTPLPEEGISFIGDGPLIISDEPGMGKSTTVVQLANRILSESVSSSNALFNYLIIIDLKSLQNLNLIDVSQNDNSFITGFSHCISGNQKFNELSKYVLLHLMLNKTERRELIILADGFDEMTYENKKLWTNILRKVKRLSHIQIIITTRPHDRENLEGVLGALSHSFVPLLNEERTQLLVNLWAAALRVEEGLELDHLTKFATEVITEAHQNLVKDREAFLGVPLQLKMLSEGFLTNAMEYVNTGGEKGGITQIKGEITLAYIYQRFIDRKYEIYMTQKLGIPGCVNPAIFQECFDEYFYKFAGDVMGDRRPYEELVLLACGQKLLSPKKLITDQVFRVGIAYEENEGKTPTFIHRTFAEFYVAKFIASQVETICYSEKDNSEKLKVLRSVLIDFDHGACKMVWVFLNDIMKDLRVRGMGYDNFKGNIENIDFFLKESANFFNFLPDYWELLMNTCIMRAGKFERFSRFYIITLGCIYGTSSSEVTGVFLLLRRILMLDPELQFRDVKFVRVRWSSWETVKLLSINDLIEQFDKQVKDPNALKESILKDPLAYVILTDHNRDEVLTCLEDYVRRNTLSREDLRKKIPHYDKVTIKLTLGLIVEIGLDSSLVNIIEQRSRVVFSPSEKEAMYIKCYETRILDINKLLLENLKGHSKLVKFKTTTD
ncbi:hypothetical protein Fcan01_22792 [Folsomia candida]|uniref:Fungal lipase-type domain-containing protein n=1 Tax=Folsomia candida TaxID=158441 RepID=A0A226DBZ8_FOLCA|nr:hypothetical protein Fcan01_22792 [Folsomia candida]